MQPQWETLLERRGILGEAKANGWRPGTFTDKDNVTHNGWYYPVYDLDGNRISERWKNCDSADKPKYVWPRSKPDGVKYYFLPGFVEATADGAITLVSGEPDLLAWRSAGARNGLCWFGEGIVPPTLADDLLALGVTSVECYPDQDDSGRKWANKIAVLLSDTGILFRAYQLPGAVGSKMDLNRLWMDCHFDQDKFWDALVQMPALPLDPILKPEKLPMLNLSAGDLPTGFYDAIEHALGVEEYGHDDWSKPIRCPLKAHEHDTPGHYAASWNRKKRIFSCLKCGVTDMLAKDIGGALGLRWTDYKEQPAPRLSTPPQSPAPRPKPAGQPTPVRSWNQGADKLLSQLEGTDETQTGEPLLLPFRALWPLGGVAKRIPLGKVVAVVADSGVGKTSLIETIIDSWRRAGFSGVMWGPEWSYEHYVQRAVQRYGGPSFNAMEEHKAYLSETKRKVSADRMTGIPLSEGAFAQTKDLIARLKALPGNLHFIEKMDAPIEAIVKHMMDVNAASAANGKRLSFAVLDYAQLADAQGESENTRVKRVLSRFKAFCADNGLVGLVGSQMTKSDGRLASNGSKGDMHSMVYARSDVFNLALVLTRKVDEQGIMSAVANCRVVKNSLGNLGDKELYLNTEKLSWHDVETRREYDR